MGKSVADLEMHVKGEERKRDGPEAGKIGNGEGK